MENQEEKKACCEGKENCEHGMHGCCGNWRKCRMLKIIFAIIVVIIAFHLGAQWGERRGEYRNNRFERSGMMNWNFDRFDNRSEGIQQRGTDEVKIDVKDTPVIPQ